MAEHHGSEILVSFSLEVLISHLISQTKQIRVGSGGIMLQHYSPYKLAENFIFFGCSRGAVRSGLFHWNDYVSGSIPYHISTSSVLREYAT
ncbi:hypothetical protein [Paenibacillus peoriae]|uniref:hypothetical protein n=1 Tax=Paenibacillus peoriae TaxID=59893 RepID=UPI0021DF6AEA